MFTAINPLQPAYDLPEHSFLNLCKYFYNIVSLRAGDEVIITNMWEQLTYRVVETRAIESYEVDKIKIQEDRDLITLLTCYYTGNNHKMRYAVYCERVIGGEEG